MKPNRLLLLILVVVIGLGCWYVLAPSHTPAPQPPLTRLTEKNFSQFRSAFNHDPASVRLVLLLSPT